MMKRRLLLDVMVDTVIRTAFVFSIFLLFSGHDAPGGGFVAGLVIGISIILRFVARGHEETHALVRARPEQLLGVGILLAVLVAGAGWWWSETFLYTTSFTVDLPLIGPVTAYSAQIFDIAVVLIVVGLVAALVSAMSDVEEVG